MDPTAPGSSKLLKRFSGVLVDSNVLLDIAYNDPSWGNWSRAAVMECAEHTTLIINPIVYAEISVGFTSIQVLDEAFPTFFFDRQPLPWSAAFLAGKCFVDYRRRGGKRATALPDFYIGAHAAVARLGLLTRDLRRYRTYFPTVELMAPHISE